MPNPLLEALGGIEDGGTSGGGSGGYFCRGIIAFGYKVFAQGVGPDASFFEFNPMAPKTAEVALAKAKSFATEHGVTTSPAKSIALTLERATVKGRQVTWSNDLQKIVARWMPAYEKVWLPALEKLNISKPGAYWMHVGLVNDPSGKTEKFKGQDGVEKDAPTKVWVPDAIFPNEALCTKAAAEAAPAAGTSAPANIPQGFTADLWKQYLPDVMKEIGGKTETEYAFCSKNWGVPVEFLKTL